MERVPSDGREGNADRNVAIDARDVNLLGSFVGARLGTVLGEAARQASTKLAGTAGAGGSGGGGGRKLLLLRRPAR